MHLLLSQGQHLSNVVILLRGFRPNEVSSAVLRAQWRSPGVRLPLDDNLLLLFWWKQWLHWGGRTAERSMFYSYGVSFLCKCMTTCVTAEVNHRPFSDHRGRAVCPMHKTTGACWLYWSGCPSKANLSECHSPQFHHMLHAALETQSLLTNWWG